MLVFTWHDAECNEQLLFSSSWYGDGTRTLQMWRVPSPVECTLASISSFHPDNLDCQSSQLFTIYIAIVLKCLNQWLCVPFFIILKNKCIVPILKSPATIDQISMLSSTVLNACGCVDNAHFINRKPNGFPKSEVDPLQKTLVWLLENKCLHRKPLDKSLRTHKLWGPEAIAGAFWGLH
jgi:hypothetical protein